MRYLKTLLSLSILFLIIIGSVACSKGVPKQEKALIKGFLEQYYEQLSYTQEEQEKINQEIEELSTKLGLADTIDQQSPQEVKPDGFYYYFKEILSPELYDNMVANRQLPNPKMLDVGLDESYIKNLRLEKTNDIVYANFKVGGSKQGQEVETKIVEIYFTLKEIGDRIYIDRINGDLGWE